MHRTLLYGSRSISYTDAVVPSHCIVTIGLVVSMLLSCSRCGSKQIEQAEPGPAAGGTSMSEVQNGPVEIDDGGKELTIEQIETLAGALEPLHEKMGTPQPGDWLHVHEEPGQSFEQYRASDPVVPGEKYEKIYILPLGEFSEGQERLIKLTATFMQVWFGVPVELQETVSLDMIPGSARRVHPSWGDKQILTGHVLYDLLLPELPDDALGYLALTTSDLWPGEGWNFVFGQASLSDRVGVWSVYRKGDADGSEKEFRVVLGRTLQTATHEMGHMIGILHCTAWECGMNGSNSLAESDRRPIHLCPECLQKLWWATGVDPVERFESLVELCAEHGLDEEKAFYERSLDAILQGGET